MKKTNRPTRRDTVRARAAFFEGLETRFLFVAPGTPATPFPANNVITNPVPTTFTWAATSNTTSYDVYLNGVLQGNVATNSWTHAPLSTTGAHTWQVIARNSADNTQTAGPTWNFNQFRVPGYDISSNQSTANMTTAYNQGIRFAYVRASRTTITQDTKVTTFVPAAKAAGILVGVYHRTLPKGDNEAGVYTDPIVDADKFIAAAGSYMGTGYLRPVVDVEDGETLDGSAAVGGYTLNTWVLAFINRIKSVKGINPLVYTGSYFSQTYINSSIVTASPDLWIANWTADTDPRTTNVDPHYPTSGTTVGTGPWRTAGQEWDFWQYDSPNGLGATYGVGSPDIDLDVFHGNNSDHSNDINLLKQNFMLGAPAIPVTPSPANSASNVAGSNLTLNWADSAGATRYDVYFDNLITPIATNVAVSQYTVGSVSGGAHKWRIVAKGASNDVDTFVGSPTWSFTASSLPLPGTPSGGTPNGTIQTVKPLVLDWADTANASTYDVYLGTAANMPLGTPSYTGLTTSQTAAISPLDGVRQWRVVARNASGDTAGPLWTYTMDSVAPTAEYGAQTPTDGSANFDFTVTYSDATSGINFTTIDSNDIVVNGPNGYSQAATLISVDLNSNGSPRVATYRVTAPGGSWDVGDNGNYNVSINANQVKDMGGLATPAGVVGIFNVNLTSPFAYQVGSVLHLEFDGTTMPIMLSHNAGTFYARRNNTIVDFTGVTSVVAHGTPSDDLLQITSSVPAALTFDNQSGNDSITVGIGASYTFDTDLGSAQGTLDLVVGTDATATFTSTQHWDSLTVYGAASMAADGDNVLVVKNLLISGDGARLDLSDNDLIVNYSGPTSPMGTVSGGAYSGLSGQIQLGANGGAWDYPRGIRTSQPDASAGLTTLAIGEASTILGIDGAQTATFSGETVDATAVLIKYTYAGDANLSGDITGDDYSAIDFNIQVPGSSDYFNGDFNYDGLVTGDDYSAIDFNIIAQGVPL